MYTFEYRFNKRDCGTAGNRADEKREAGQQDSGNKRLCIKNEGIRERKRVGEQKEQRNSWKTEEEVQQRTVKDN
jgi:hypothetical protein